MRDVLEDWSDDPLSLLGALLIASVVGALGSAILDGVINPVYKPGLKEVGEWSGYIFVVSFLSTMVLGGMSSGNPGSIRSMAPLLCLLVGLFFLVCSNWYVGPPLQMRVAEHPLIEEEILWGRAGLVLIVIAVVLGAGKCLVLTTKRHRYS